jgi:hypothetical protein
MLVSAEMTALAKSLLVAAPSATALTTALPAALMHVHVVMIAHARNKLFAMLLHDFMAFRGEEGRPTIIYRTSLSIFL